MAAKWAATFATSNGMDIADTTALDTAVGYGDTPLEAAADLLNAAVALRRRNDLVTTV